MNIIEKIIFKLIGLEKDTLLHVLCSLVISGLLVGLIKHVIPTLLSAIVVAVIVGVVTIWKEVIRDWWQKKGDPDWRDVLSNAVGFGIGALLGIL